MACLPRPVMMMIWSHPDATASSTPYWMMGLSTRGSISLGIALVAGRNLVPRPAAGKTALRTFFGILTSSSPHEPKNHMDDSGPRGPPIRVNLQRRSVTPPHALANDLHGHRTLPHEAIVEFLQRKFAALLLTVVFAQFQDLEFAQIVVEIRRVGRTTPGFNLGDGRNLEAFFNKEFLPLFQRHLAGVHFDADNEARVAQQRVQQLSQPQPGIVIAVTFVEHHLLGVMGPAFGIAGVVEHFARFGGGRLQPEKLRVVSGI